MNGVGISRQVIKKTTLGYLNPYVVEFKPSNCVATADPWYDTPTPCDIHPDCFLARGLKKLVGGYVRGHWKALTPTPIPPGGYGWYIEGYSFGGMQKHSTGWGGWVFKSYLKLISDNSPRLDLQTINFLTDNYAGNKQSNLNVNLGANLDLDLYMECVPGITSSQLDMHISKILLSTFYYTATTPPACEVEIMVLNQETGSPISGATVIILQGSTEIKRIATNSQGIAIIKNVFKGSYTLRILSSGYYKVEEAITVNYPKTSEVKYMNKSPYEIPWIWIIGGVGALVAVAGIVIITKKKYPQFLVMR